MDHEVKTKRRPAKAVVEPAQMVPVSQTHRVQAVQGSARSALERAHEERQDRLRDLEDELLSESLSVVAGAISFAEINGDEESPSGDFLEKFRDHPDPEKLFRIMKAANKSAKEAPIGLAIAQRTAMGIIKARATEKAAPRPLAVSVQVVTAMPEFKVLDVKGE
jgi:hypothetical protein